MIETLLLNVILVICQSWVHTKSNSGSNDPWYCFSGCSLIFLFGTPSNKGFISSTTNFVSQSINSDSDKYSFTTAHSDLVILLNEFNKTFPEKKNEPESVVNSKYNDINQIETLEYLEKHKSLSLFNFNACYLKQMLMILIIYSKAQINYLT